MIGTAWVFTGWTVVGGTVFIFGFLFYFDITPPPITTTPRPTTGVTSTPSTTEGPTTPPMNFSICGIPASALSQTNSAGFNPILDGIISQRIIGGVTAIEGNWPWMTYIYEFDSGIINGHKCGGTLLTNDWILTAAHCMESTDPVVYGVVLGEHTVSVNSSREVYRRLSQIVIYPNYNTLTFNFDVALIKMDQRVEFSDFIRPGCIVPSNTPTDATSPPTFADNRLCTIIGWGVTSSASLQQPDQLMQLNLRILPDVLCRAATLQGQREYNNRNVLLNDPKFCGGGALGEDSCNGDSGGPLVCKHEDGFYYVHGITSYGTQVCAQPNLPGVYTKMANPIINEWITTTILT